MSAAVHTPGPWDTSYNEGWPFCQTVYVRAAGWGLVAAVNIDPQMPHLIEQQRANLRLIAAAPELLELVRISIGNVRSLGPAGALGDVPHAPYREWLAQLEAAYAKATGSAS